MPAFIVQSTDDPEITCKTDLNPLVKAFMSSSATDVVKWLKQGQMQNAQLVEAIELPTAQLAPFDDDLIK